MKNMAILVVLLHFAEKHPKIRKDMMVVLDDVCGGKEEGTALLNEYAAQCMDFDGEAFDNSFVEVFRDTLITLKQKSEEKHSDQSDQ